MWDRAAGTSPRRIEWSGGPLNDLQFSPDESLLAIAGRDLAVYDVAQCAALRRIRSDGRNYGCARFSPDAQVLLVVTGTAAIETIDVRSGAAHAQSCCSSIYGEVAFTPDGRSIVNAGHWPGIRDSLSGRLLGRLTREREFYTFGPIAFAGGDVLMGSQDGRVYCWDLATKRLVAVSPLQPGYVSALAVTAGGWVASSGKMLRLWNPRTGEQRVVPAAVPASNLIAAPDGASILFGTRDGRVEQWDVRSGQRGTDPHFNRASIFSWSKPPAYRMVPLGLMTKTVG